VSAPTPRAGTPAPTPSRLPDPYRLLFPIGLTWGVIGAGLWPLHALGAVPWPSVGHRALMIQGFEHSFVLGFLLTAIPGFTKGERCRPAELAIAVLSALAFGIATLAGQALVAQSAFVLSMVMLLVAVARRLRRPGVVPPLELMFVGFGLVLGLAGAAVQLAEAAGLVAAPPRFGERLVSLGMVLSLVLGVGGLLVPTFTGMRSPLVIPGVAGAHERRGRLAFNATLIATFALAFVAELAGQPRAGALLRAATATTIGLMVWKLWRLPGRRDVPAFVMWGSGWLVMAGLWAVALVPAFTLGGLHLVFIGGFALITLGIGTRVVVAHGRHPIADERRVLSAPVVALVALALLARLAAEWWPAGAVHAFAASGAAWMLGWLLWAIGALPRIVRVAAAP
jgi:uncharacterized protein involved in response to NO